MLVEEEDVEREAHADRVNARAARNQEARPDHLAIEMGEAEETSSPIGRHSHPMAEDGYDRKASKARGDHRRPKPSADESLPRGSYIWQSRGASRHGEARAMGELWTSKRSIRDFRGEAG